MANKNLFKSASPSKKALPITNTINKAGGVAYDLGSEGALAQYVVTGCLGNTYYASATEQVDKVLELAGKCSDEFVAKAAVYGHRVARMKDTPALLANVLANRGPNGLVLLERIFPKVISSTKMLRNFVQILRSGKCGRKSFGTSTKRMINNWLESQDDENLFKQSLGNDPSLADVVKMTHPKPSTKQRETFYKWLLGKPYDSFYLPVSVRKFEGFKKGSSEEVPDVDFRMLSNHFEKVGVEGWKNFARKGGWNFLRMNLNNLKKYDCFADQKFVDEVADKLRDPELIRKFNAFPYQLLTSYQNTNDVPMVIKLALQDALEVATQNVPTLAGNTAVCVDISGSMDSPATGQRGSATSVTTCRDVSALMASCLLRKNPSTTVVPFHTQVQLTTLNPRDTVLTNSKILRQLPSGGTNCACALRHLNVTNWKGDNVIFVSDNESWVTNYSGRGTELMSQWKVLKQSNPKAKLVCIDIQPGSTTQAPDGKDILNVGGMSDAVFEVVANFVNNDNSDFVKVIKDSVSLD